MVTADDVRDNLHKIQELGPKGQYFVSTPNRVIGMVSTQRVESATANVAIKMFRAVFIPAIQHYSIMRGIIIQVGLTSISCHCNDHSKVSNAS